MDLVTLVGSTLGLVGLLLAAVLGERRGGWWIAAAVVLAATAAGRLAGPGAAGAALGAVGELAALGLLLADRDPATRAAASLWARALVPGILAVAAGLALTGFGHVRPSGATEGLATACFALGFAAKMALVPLYFWLPAVARRASATSLLLIAVVIDTGVAADLAELGDVAPWLFADHRGLWIGLAAASLLGGAVLAIAERDLKAIVAFTGVVDGGFLILGVAAADPMVREGVWFAILGQAFAKAALFGAIAVAERVTGSAPSIDTTRGLACRLPVASGVFMVGAGALVGLPPSLAFSAHWRLFRAAAEVGGPAMVAVVLVAAGAVLLVMVRAMHRVWLGPSETTDEGRAPALANALLVAAALAIAIGGVVPRAFAPAAAEHHVALAEDVR